MTTASNGVDLRRRAGWLPDSQDDLESWLSGHRQRVQAIGEHVILHPSVTEFQELIDSDPVVRMYVHRMVAEVPHTGPYRKNHLGSVEHMLRLINAILTFAPEFGENAVITPLCAIFDWAMGTPSGFAAFRDPRINAALKKILSAWCEFLDGADSLYVLNDSPSGWKCAAARRAIGIEQFQHDPQDEHWGFRSWNDFFTRRFKDGARPLASPDDDNVIVNACESTPYRLATGVKRQDRFWLKSQPYSLRDMLANDDSVEQFVGGTVYQAYLSAMNYHRWHSPVAGTIVRAFLRQGTYFSEVVSEDWDAVPPPVSQSYLAHVAVRAIILIDADNPVIGLVAFVAVGMDEVSSCMIGDNVKPGHHVAKGEGLGYFQFGGSTHCLVFRPGAIADFTLAAVPRLNDPNAPLVRVRSKLATANRTA
ncbi:phosphatidylserine decarboxylase family protein [Mycobacterium sp.]|uniref:phosphatidylserine decarboxylase family protein n=1 Tax=Mycobacterium sp. TaxID=1785 RepID=UPI002B572129|nr:phosphatidylserine decarboxylase family protein [Mycobacterium sp.]HTY33987.1 phosphatidylserine decarboxylase family protein [Mycobacterium sp.]